MIISCPSCSAKYLVNIEDIGFGRQVKCTRCNHSWFHENKNYENDKKLQIEEIIKSLDQNIHVSARCLKQIIDLAKGWAIVHGKDYLTHQDIKDILPYILRHRIKFLDQDEKFDFIKKEILEKIVIKK